MEMRQFKIVSGYDGLELDTMVTAPDTTPKGIVQFSHGMAEHKERYLPFMKYLSKNGYICVIHDHRGHGGSVKDPGDLGYFYTLDSDAIVSDLLHVTTFIKNRCPGLPLYLFAHSMGTLVARVYAKQHDGEIDKLILCGPPTENKMVDFGLKLCFLTMKIFKEKQGNTIMNTMAFAPYAKKHNGQFAWLSRNPDNVEDYIADPLCGYTFTTNGFVNLLQLQKEAYVSDDWTVTNPELPILVMAGEEDPVIQSKELFDGLVAFLQGVGYENVTHKLYAGLRHELLNELGNEFIYEDVLRFMEQ